MSECQWSPWTSGATVLWPYIIASFRASTVAKLSGRSMHTSRHSCYSSWYAACSACCRPWLLLFRYALIVRHQTSTLHVRLLFTGAVCCSGKEISTGCPAAAPRFSRLGRSLHSRCSMRTINRTLAF
jgi:hypothetical protein